MIDFFRDELEAACEIFGGPNEGILIADTSSLKFRLANKTVCEMFGYEKSEMLELSVIDIHPEAEHERLLNIFELMSCGDLENIFDVECKRRDGSLFFSKIRVRTVNINGKRCLVGYFTDVNQRIEVNKALEEMSQTDRAEKNRIEHELTEIAIKYLDLSRTLETVLDAIPDIIGVQDLQHGIIRYNRAGYEFLQTSPDEIVGKKCFQLLGKERRCEECATSEVYKTNRPARKERFFPEFSKWLEINAYPVLDENARITKIIEHIRDVTRLKKAEEKRVEYERQVQQAQKLESLGILAGGIAHDFNNLLAGIYGYLHLAVSKIKDGEEKKYIDIAIKTMERAKALTQQLLTFSKGGAPRLETGRVDSLISDVVEFSLCGSKASVNVSIQKGLWACSYDRNQVGQVINNLMINAQQAMDEGGEIKVTAANIKVNEGGRIALPPGCYVKITISDTGTGIPRDLFHRIFEPFFTTKENGSGLGLSMAYSIVKKHNGVINVESKPGKGTTFKVYLPAIEKYEDPSKTEPESVLVGAGCVLIMDDEKIIRGALSRMLQHLGFETLEASNGKKALELLDNNFHGKPDICGVILDLTIPGGMGGKEVIHEIRKRDLYLPVFASSGYSEDPIIQQPTEYGFTDSLKKPFSLSDLTLLLSRHLKKE